MSCPPFDLRDYLFEELGAAERTQVDSHLAACAGCRQELERLRLTRAALLHLKDEEMPRRIALVSDKVFEPSRAARWWGAVPRFAFGAALLLAVFFGGAWISSPSITVEQGRWQIAFGGSGAEVTRLEARHAAEMRNLEQTYELLVKQMNVLYRQSAEMRPALVRQ